jgi:2-phosphoglycerate kinase
MSGPKRSEQDDALRGRRTGRVCVTDSSGQRPFMRGIMVHSLTSKGLAFEEAVEVANRVRDRIRDRDEVSRRELAALVAESAEVEFVIPPDEIRVTGSGSGMPFSKGFLSQSLLAAAIEPPDAFDVAREIETRLLMRGAEEIHRRELRKLAFDALYERVGESAAQRYLAWRHYQRDPVRPVILLLGGTAGSGKTSLAREVAYRLGVSRVISTDSIRQVMRIMLSQELLPALHRSSYDAHEALSGVPGEDSIVDAFRSQAASVSVGVRAMIDRAISENENLILDGVSLVPGSLNLDAYHERAEIIFLMIATFEKESFRSRFATRGEAAKGRPPHRYLENLDAILRIQDYLLEMSDSNQVPIVENDSFDRSVVSIIRSVTESLREKGAGDAASLP